MRTLVEQCQKVNINELVKTLKPKLFDIQVKSEMKIAGQLLEITTTPCNFGGKRLWFICRDCKSRVGTLYKLPTNENLLCRKCNNLVYTKSRYHKMPGFDLSTPQVA